MPLKDSLNTAVKTALNVQAFTNPALAPARLPSLIYGIGSKIKNSYFNNNKPPVQKNSLESLASLGATGAQQGIASGQQNSLNPSGSNQSNSNYSTSFNGRSAYNSTPQYNFNNEEKNNFVPNISLINTDFSGKPYTPYVDNGYKNETQNTTPAANPYNDRLKALQDKLNGLNEGLMGYLKPGQSELDTQAQLDALQGKLRGITASRDLGIADIKNQPIAMNFITGQGKNLIDQAEAKANALGAEAEPLTTRLARLQADRQQGFDAAKFQIGNAQTELERLQKESNPIEVGGNLVRLNPATGQYETIFKNPAKAADEGFTLGEGQMRYDSKGNLIASGAPKSSAEQLTNDIKEYNFARQQGYTGSFTDFKNSNAGGGSLPAAYREYQLSQSDPGFANYLKGSKPQTAEQLKAADFASRMQSADQIINQLQNVGAGNFGIFGQALPNVLKSSDRQQLEQAQRTFLNAVLRRESGAAISPEEFRSGSQQYFPQPGDSPQTLQQKAALRSQVTQSMLSQAGGGRQNSINPQEIQQLKGAGYSDQQIQQFMSQRGFNQPLSMGVKGSPMNVFAQKFPDGSPGGQCASFARKLVNIPPLGNGLNDKKAWVDKIGMPASAWRQNPQIGDVIISNDNPTYGHVAVVNKIFPDGRVQVTESNYKRSDTVSHDRIVPINSSRIYGVIRAPLKV